MTFLWLRFNEIFPFSIPNARYAVVFSIEDDDASFRSLDLAYLLLSFIDQHAHSHVNRFFLLDIVYTMTTTGSLGVMIFDQSFSGAFSAQRDAAAVGDSSFPYQSERSLHNNIPISCLNGGSSINLDRLIFNARSDHFCSIFFLC